MRIFWLTVVVQVLEYSLLLVVILFRVGFSHINAHLDLPFNGFLLNWQKKSEWTN